jgi:hypothetical protein
MNYYIGDKINKVTLDFTHWMYDTNKVLKVALLNINFTFSCDNGFNESLEKIEPTEYVKIAPIKHNLPKKSNRGKKTNKTLKKKMNKFGSNVKFLVYDEVYDNYFTVIVFRINSGDIPGLAYTDYSLVHRLIHKVLNVINTQYPDKNFRYIDYKINLCNLKGRVLLDRGNFMDIEYKKWLLDLSDGSTLNNKRGPLREDIEHKQYLIDNDELPSLEHKVINVYILRDILYIIHNIYNPNIHDCLLKDKHIQQIREIDANDKDIILRENFVDCIFKESNVYLSIKYRIDDKIVSTKVYNNGKMYALGSKNIITTFDILYNLRHIIYRYNAYLF